MTSSPVPVLYFVRHGETDFNAAQRLQGRYQTSLNARGREQAVVAAGVLRDLSERDNHWPDDLAYVSSPLVRARETMVLVRSTLGLAPDVYDTDDRLMEISYGEWEGLTLQEIQARTPDVLAQRDRDKWDFRPPGGESYREVAQRVGDWYASLKRDTVTVAHGGIARVLMANFHVLPEEEATYAQIGQGAVYVFANGGMARYA